MKHLNSVEKIGFFIYKVKVSKQKCVTRASFDDVPEIVVESERRC
jgi:hypothetical protein